jgi:hypothetical protein
MLEKIRSFFRTRDEGPRTESDVDLDRGTAVSRAAGGRPQSDGGDSAVTTGTGDSGVHVGRVAGQDEGYAGTTGAEARAEQERD